MPGTDCSRDNLDILIYNVMPDILPIHRDITPEMTHRMERFKDVPGGYAKARFIQFHLLVDDLSHHGHITRRGHERFENASDGYAYRKGASLTQAMIELHRQPMPGRSPPRRPCTGRT